MSPKTPDTEIPCTVCRGSKLHPLLARRKVPCGACFASGLSTYPWHQRRNATTITGTPDEIRAREAAGQVVESHKFIDNGRRVIALVSWANPRYESELAAARAEVRS